jgi:dipeptidyl aminopeptidase/acylaminoacyl peptidase
MAIFGRKKTFLSEGKRFLGIMLYEEALRQLNQSIERRENLNEAYFYCAAASFLKTDMSAAKKFLGMLIDLNPDPKTIKMICDLTGMKKLVSNKYRNALPCFSRDGKRIVFASSRKKIENSIVNNNTGIYIVDVDTGEEFQVVKDEFNNYMPFFFA